MAVAIMGFSSAGGRTTGQMGKVRNIFPSGNRMSPLSALGTFKSQNKIKFPPKHNLVNWKLSGQQKLSEPFNHPAVLAHIFMCVYTSETIYRIYIYVYVYTHIYFQKQLLFQVKHAFYQRKRRILR